MKTELEGRVSSILELDDKLERMRRLRELKENMPAETFSTLVSMMDSPDDKTRRRAAHALNWFRSLAPQRADVLATHLEHDSNPEVRLTCAILLMDVKHPAVDLAYARATLDSEEKVAMLACNQIGYLGGATGIAVLLDAIRDARPKVRLHACIALIRLEAADDSVVSTLEELRPLPEVIEYFKEDPEVKEVWKALWSSPVAAEFFKGNPETNKFFEEVGDFPERETFESLFARASLMAKANSRK